MYPGLQIKYSSLLTSLLILFWVYATLFYTSLNYAGVYGEINRFILFSLIILSIIVSLVFKRKLWISSLNEPVSFSVFLYFLYIFISFSISLSIGNVAIKYIASFVLNCFLPITFYFVGKYIKSWKIIIFVIVVVTLINSLFAIITSPFVDVDIPYFNDLANQYAFRGGSEARLQSLIGNSTTLGYFALICISIYISIPNLRFRYIILTILIVTVIMSRQRGGWIGIVLMMFLHIYYSFGSREIRMKSLRIFLVLAILSFIIYLLFTNYTDSSTLGFLLSETFNRITLADTFGNRGAQMVIFNDSNFFSILFGEGFGKYSPLNLDNPLRQPDAPYYMVFNETGMIGLLIFLNMFFQIAKRAFRDRNFILLFIVLHLSIGLLGSRYLWYFPINYLFYFFVGVFYENRTERLKRNNV